MSSNIYDHMRIVELRNGKFVIKTNSSIFRLPRYLCPNDTWSSRIDDARLYQYRSHAIHGIQQYLLSVHIDYLHKNGMKEKK